MLYNYNFLGRSIERKCEGNTSKWKWIKYNFKRKRKYDFNQGLFAATFSVTLFHLISKLTEIISKIYISGKLMGRIGSHICSFKRPNQWQWWFENCSNNKGFICWAAVPICILSGHYTLFGHSGNYYIYLFS